MAAIFTIEFGSAIYFRVSLDAINLKIVRKKRRKTQIALQAYSPAMSASLPDSDDFRFALARHDSANLASIVTCRYQ
tara:strand:- start:173 stop:403 length:231 start_codon:yes stop_codon:yes gene_type:complete